MPTPADERLLEVLEKWLKSLALHERYAGLDADSYARVQPWPAHERPSRWIIDLARQKTLALRAQVEERIRTGDTQFAEALELMAFLTNLVGSEHIERFIPLASPENEQPIGRARPPEPEEPAAAADPAPEPAPPPARARAPAAPAGPPPAPAAPAPAPARAHKPAIPAPRAHAAAPRSAKAPPSPADNAPTREMPMAPLTSSEFLSTTASREVPAVSVTATREMPQFRVAGSAPAHPAAPAQPTQPARPSAPTRAPSPAATPHVARAERRPAASAAAKAGAAHPRASGKASGGKHPARIAPAGQEAREQVVADAARLLQWGRKWFELAELIARMADRPSLPEVRRILKDQKTAIEKKAGRG